MDLAIAIVVGTAFTAVVKAFVADIITPLIAAIYGGEAFTDLYFTVHNSRFLIGDFINNVSHLFYDPLAHSCVLAH